jgi:hypothetical protein
MAQEPAADQVDFEKSVDQVRATTKWILVAFAAVGTVLAAGSQLSSIGQFTWLDLRMWVAVVAIVVVLAAISVSIWFVVGVETAGEVSLRALDPDDIKFVNENPALLDGYPSVEMLRHDYYRYIDKKYEASQAGNQDELNFAMGWVEYLGAVVGQLLDAVRYDRVTRKFAQARNYLIVMSLCAGVAVVTFAWAANPEPAVTESAAFKTPTEGYVMLTKSGQTMLADSLGEDCTKHPVRVAVLSAESGSYDAVSIPTGNCELLRFTVNNETGSVMPPDKVAIRSKE